MLVVPSGEYVRGEVNISTGLAAKSLSKVFVLWHMLNSLGRFWPIWATAFDCLEE